MHRGGGTLLQRIVNASPGVLIWGEHGGFINKLAEADTLMTAAENLSHPVAERRLDQFLLGKGQSDFDPWTTPAERSAFRSSARDYIRQTFDIVPGNCWGFKEIRYHSVRTARFLLELFPWSRIVLLRRKLEDVVISSLTAPWSLPHLKDIPPTRAFEPIADAAYAAAVISRGFDEIAAAFSSERVISVRFEELASELPSMFAFLALEQPDGVSAVLNARIGATSAAAQFLGLSRSDLRHDVEHWVARSQMEIARHGVDKVRLAASEYAFLIGDHDARPFGLSSIF